MRTVAGSASAGATLPGSRQAAGAAVLGYRVLSHAFRIRTDVEELAATFRRLLAPFADPEASGPEYVVRRPGDADGGDGWYVLERDGEELGRAVSPQALVPTVLWRMNADALAAAGEHLALHAGAASWRRRGVLVPGPPDSGKTTLVAGLVAAGFSYLTDEAALVDPDTLLVRPYPRPLTMTAASARALAALGAAVPAAAPPGGQELVVAPDDLRAGSVGPAAPVRYVVEPSYRRGAPTVLTPVPRAAAVAVLARNSFNFPRFGARGLALLRAVVADARCFRLQSGDLPAAVSAVARLVTDDDSGGAE